MRATWSKIKSSGEWGVRVEADGHIGQEVEVQSKAGKVQTRFLARQIAKYNDAEYWTVTDEPIESF